ncbi:MAG: prepilin-type N-terminal cleavage/methylation domain-containing protein [Acidiferrobacterales bacterium]
MMRNRSHGFTLVELIMVIVLLGIAAVAIISGYGQVARSLSTNANLQAGTQLARECGEYLIAQRRDNPLVGYSGVSGSSFCSTLPNPQGLTVTVAFTDPYGGAACGGISSCKLADITVTQGTQTLDSASLMLANY